MTMQLEALRAAWARGEAVSNGWVQLANPFAAELMARSGVDSVTVDTQHGLIEVHEAIAMLPGLNAANVVPFARVNWNEPAPIMKLLDAGMMGLICPMVNSRVEAEQFVGACRYAPVGYRSLGPTRAAIVYGADYPVRANADTIALPMIETRAGLDNLTEILTVEGVDGVYVGPGDLSLSLRGKAGLDHQDDEMLGILRRIVETAGAHGKVAGIYTGSATYARQMRSMGFQFLTIACDTRLLKAAADAAVAVFHQP
jgi:4-hydroxy-2-oxoheptanedioate aldolase